MAARVRRAREHRESLSGFGHSTLPQGDQFRFARANLAGRGSESQ
jgi:hypothetical protein